ncbi:hypothetical protein [Catellatospora sp. NPDC049609]|uniref:hypothetical protein n=1 Tax=Catellatospora sp. NPDC049609 TaxID=3155505 RepID=UPI003444F746
MSSHGRTGRSLLVSAVVVVMALIGLVADVLGIRSALFPPGQPAAQQSSYPVHERTEAAARPDPTEHDPVEASPSGRPTPPPVVVSDDAPSSQPIVERQPSPKPPSCVVGTWILVGRVFDDPVPGEGVVRMSLVQGGERRQFRSDGTTSVEGNFVLEGRAPNHDLLARNPVGTGGGRYRVTSSTITETDFTSTGTTYFYRNHQLMSQQPGPVFGDGSAEYTCTPTTLTVRERSGVSEYSRQ